MLVSLKACVICRVSNSRLPLILMTFLVCGASFEIRAADFTLTNQPTPAGEALSSSTLTNAEQIHRLTGLEAATRRHVLIHGVVTCTLPQFGATVVQEGTTGIYINNVNRSSNGLPHVGDLVEVEGATEAGEFAPRVQASRITPRGSGPLPAPVHPYWDQMINGSLDTEFVEIEGIVTSILTNVPVPAPPGGLFVTLRTHDGKINVLAYDRSAGNETLLKRSEEALIRLRGCLFASWNAATRHVNIGEVFMYDPSVTIVEPAPADAFADALKSVPDLLLFDPRASALRRVKVSGQIMGWRTGEYYAMDGTNGFRFLPRQAVSCNIGQLVEVVGFPNLTGPSPVFQEAIVRKVGMAPLRDARPLGTRDLFRARNDAVRVTVEAVLLNQSQDQKTFDLQAGLQRFVARLDGTSEALPETAGSSPGEVKGRDYPIGSRLALTGVYAGYGGNRPASEDVAGFELLVQSPADIQMLARPPFWTLQRTLVLVGVLVGILTLSLIWIRLLHHEVQQRTVQLETEVQNREQAERQHALAQERARIARDLHDDLGSSLTEISMLATTSPSLKLPADGAAERMESIAGKSRSLVKALDEIVWVVDPERDTLASVVRYLASYVEEYLSGINITSRVQIPNSFHDQPVSGQVRHHVFLAVKEALNNAVRHGGASEITFRLQVLDENSPSQLAHSSRESPSAQASPSPPRSGGEGRGEVVLRAHGVNPLVHGRRLSISITDNGAGFDPSGPSSGHGLANLRERLQQLHGQCEFQSAPGAGTTVVLEVPLTASKNLS